MSYTYMFHTFLIFMCHLSPAMPIIFIKVLDDYTLCSFVFNYITLCN